MPQPHRRRRFEIELTDLEPGVLNEHYEGDGVIIFKHACKLGCEGIVSKRAWLALSRGTFAVLGEGQEPKSTSREARGRRGLGKIAELTPPNGWRAGLVCRVLSAEIASMESSRSAYIKWAEIWLELASRVERLTALSEDHSKKPTPTAEYVWQLPPFHDWPRYRIEMRIRKRPSVRPKRFDQLAFDF